MKPIAWRVSLPARGTDHMYVDDQETADEYLERGWLVVPLFDSPFAAPVRYTMSEAEREGAIRDLRINAGWTQQNSAPQPPAEPVADYPECSGNPADCPENEGFGCCGIGAADPDPLPTTADALRWLDEVEACQGGANGPTIKLRASILALGEPVTATVEEPASPQPPAEPVNATIPAGWTITRCEHGWIDVTDPHGLTDTVYGDEGAAGYQLLYRLASALLDAAPQPHGFDRTAGHSAGRHMCECEGCPNKRACDEAHHCLFTAPQPPAEPALEVRACGCTAGGCGAVSVAA